MGMVERSFADLEYESKKHKTGRELFLQKMEDLIRWDQLVEAIKPYYPQSAKGRVPYPLESILRVHCVQLFYNLSDPATEDMLYEIESVRRFIGGNKVPDETTILNFRHLLERHGLGKVLFETIKGAPGRARTEAEGRDDSGCRHHCGAVLKEEPQWGR